MATSNYNPKPGKFINTLLWNNNPSGQWNFKINKITASNIVKVSLHFNTSILHTEQFIDGSFSWIFFQNNSFAALKHEIKTIGSTHYNIFIYSLSNPSISSFYKIQYAPYMSSSQYPQLHFHPSVDGLAFLIFITDGNLVTNSNHSHTHQVIRTDTGSLLCEYGAIHVSGTSSEIQRNAQITINKNIEIFSSPYQYTLDGIRVYQSCPLKQIDYFVVIEKIYPSSITNNPGEERVVISNMDSKDINMTNWILKDKVNHRYQFPDNFILQKNKVINVWTKSGTDDSTNLYWKPKRSQAVWNNLNGDTAYLIDENGQQVSFYNYKQPKGTSVPNSSPNVYTPDNYKYEILDGLQIRVRESDKIVDTGLDFLNGEFIHGRAEGNIWAGIWFTGSNDADGWPEWAAGNKFPLPSAPPFSLIGRFGNNKWQRFGTQFGPFQTKAGRLFLRTNDPVPGNADTWGGGGSFNVSLVKMTKQSNFLPLINKNSLLPGESMGINEELNSLNGAFKLLLQNDGNLVLYDLRGISIWSTNTNGSNVYSCKMETDGNLVLKRRNGTLVWNSKTQGNKNAQLVLENDRNLCIYKISSANSKRRIWHTKTRLPW